MKGTLIVAALIGAVSLSACTTVDPETGERRLTQLLMRYVGKRLVARAGGRLVPVIGAPISAVQNGGSTKELGRRAIEYYGGKGD